jgi:hypothetical protein
MTGFGLAPDELDAAIHAMTRDSAVDALEARLDIIAGQPGHDAEVAGIRRRIAELMRTGEY